MSIKIIFLDIDGVVNRWDTKERAPSKVIGVEQCLIALIKQIVDATGAKIVLSSTWRKDWAFDLMDGKDWYYLRDEFAKQDLHFLDYTTGYDITSYVVIDDEMFDIRDLHKGHMVQTSFNDGITKGGVDMAIKILSKEDNPCGDAM